MSVEFDEEPQSTLSMTSSHPKNSLLSHYLRKKGVIKSDTLANIILISIVIICFIATLGIATTLLIHSSKHTINTQHYESQDQSLYRLPPPLPHN